MASGVTSHPQQLPQQGHKPDKYEKDFDAVVAFLSQYIIKRALTPSVKIASAGQNRPTKWQKISNTHCTFKGKIELKKYSRKENDSMSTTQCQQQYELWITR